MSAPGAVMDVSCLVSTTYGWLNLNDHINYELESTTGSTRAISFTRHEIKSSFASGLWVVDAHQNLVEETLSVWVTGTSPASLNKYLNKLIDAITQLNFVIDWKYEDSGFRWRCQVADLQVLSKKELMFANRAQVVARVRRNPEVDWFNKEDSW